MTSFVANDQEKSKSLEDLVDNDINDDGFIYPADVEEAMLEVIGGTDPLDGPNFDPVDYINSLFPTEQSLANIDEVVTRIRTRIRKLDDDIRYSIHKQTITVENGKQSLEETKGSIKEVFQKIKDIKERADKSEEMVKEITCDIKQLDHGKRHLTNSITTLNHLHMLVGGVDSLVLLSKNRQYGEVANLLEGVVNVLEHFKKYNDIPQIKQLSDRVKVIQATLGQQVLSDFKDNVGLGEVKPQTGPHSILHECCRVANALEPKIKDEMLMWFIKLQLSDYLNVYNESFDVAWIDKIDRRYSWFKRLLIQFEEDYNNVFPPDWGVDERIANEFCLITRRELEKIMTQRKSDIDVKLLLFAIQRTTAFEGFLSKRFSYSQLKKEKVEFDFNGLVTRCFESHLHIYIEAQERNLGDLIDKFLSDFKVHGVPSLTDETEGYVLPSAGELFVFYKKCMVQCLQLSNSKPLLHLAETFKKYLAEYGNKLLLGNLPKVTSTSGITSILKDKDSEVKFNEEEKRTICCMLTTAEYCQETTQQLQDKLCEKISSELVEHIDMNSQQDLFHGVISTSIQLLVQDLENLCEPALSVMIKVNWQNVESVGDQSSYVTAIISHLRSTIPMVRDNLYSSRKYFTQFCIKFVNSFIPRYINNVYKCKPLSDVGAEQLLLDTHSMKTVLLDLPSIGSTVQRKPPNSFTKIVIKGMSKAEMILKVVMSPHQPQTVFVDSYIKLLGDMDPSNFQKLLEMKGLKRNDQHSLLEIFRGKLSATPAKTDTSSVPSTTSASDSSRIRRLEKLIKKQF